MLPSSENYEDDEYDEESEADFDVETEPSRTYAMVLSKDVGKKGIFLGIVDEEEALRQAIMKIISTERYAYEIYSWDYGIELSDLIGKPMNYAMSEVKLRIEDALTADDRIEAVEDFQVTRIGKNMLHVTFTVITAEGETIEGIETEVEV